MTHFDPERRAVGECPLTTTEAIRYGEETLAFAAVDQDEAPGWLVTCEYFGDDSR